MAISDQYLHFLSRPVPIHWSGWETDTHRLQRAGWVLAVDKDPIYDNYKVLIHNDQVKMYAITSAMSMSFSLTENLISPMPILEIQYAASKIEFYRTNEDFSQFRQIDAQPQVVHMNAIDFDDLCIFKYTTPKAEEIIIDKADMTVVEHLQAIKDLQSPKQKEIRERILLNQSEFHAENDIDQVANIVAFKRSA